MMQSGNIGEAFLHQPVDLHIGEMAVDVVNDGQVMNHITQ